MCYPHEAVTAFHNLVFGAMKFWCCNLEFGTTKTMLESRLRDRNFWYHNLDFSTAKLRFRNLDIGTDYFDAVKSVPNSILRHRKLWKKIRLRHENLKCLSPEYGISHTASVCSLEIKIAEPKFFKSWIQEYGIETDIA